MDYKYYINQKDCNKLKGSIKKKYVFKGFINSTGVITISNTNKELFDSQSEINYFLCKSNKIFLNSNNISKKYTDLINKIFDSELWDQHTKKEIQSVKNEWIKYTNNIEKLEIPKFPENKKNLSYFYKLFLKTIFEQISVKDYYCESTMFLPETKNDITIFRPNHGGLNHLRSILFANKLLLILKNNNEPVFKDICPTKNHIVCLLLSSLFKSLLRTGEGGKCCGLKNMPDELFGVIYPLLKEKLKDNYKLFLNKRVELFHLSSGILLKSILEKLNINNIEEEYIEMLDLANTYYFDKHNQQMTEHFNLFESKSAENFEYDISKPEYKILLVCCIMSSGHYLDHCRGPFSTMFAELNIAILRKTAKITNTQDSELLKFILNTINKTEFSPVKDQIPPIIPSDKKYSFDNTISNSNCYNLGKRWSDKFFELSQDFDKSFKELDLEANFNELLE